MVSKKRHADVVHKASGEINFRSIEETNLYRRNLLKLFAVGGGAFLVGKFMDPVINLISGDRVISMRDFQNFRLVESGREIKVLDKDGGEILIVDKDAIGS
ncbi:MAG: hypothetical protein WA058_01830 [Minisyncoccia bacterium]